MPYQIEGRLLEVCTCNVVCPCWLGQDPDRGTCEGLLVWSVDKGTVNGTDVSGHVLGILAHIPGNILKGNWKARVYVDDKASKAQMDALLGVWTGQLGGPVADMAKLVGEVLSVEQTPKPIAARSRFFPPAAPCASTQGVLLITVFSTVITTINRAL